MRLGYGILSHSASLAQWQSNGFVIDNTVFSPNSPKRTTGHSMHGHKGLRKIAAVSREPKKHPKTPKKQQT